MSSYPECIPVVVVGAGPTGLTCANLLHTYGVPYLLLDKADGPLNIPRAIVLDDEGSRTLQTFGLHRTYLTTTVPGQGSRYFDDNGICFAETGAGPMTFGFPMRQFILQPELEDALRAALDERGDQGTIYRSEVTGITQDETGATVTVRDAGGSSHAIRTRWVLACDGGRSPIRDLLAITMTGNTYAEDWIVVDTQDDPDQEPVSKFFCSHHRPSVSVPAPRGGRRYEFMLLDGEARDEMLTPGVLAELLRPFRVYDERKVLRKTVYTFHARIADRYRQGRTVLLGDAAHLTPPFAGQGMNAGLRDAHNVVWKIAAVEKGGASTRIMDSYELERRKPAWDMIQLAVTMGKFVMPRQARDIEFRERLLENLAPYPAVRDFLIQMRFKPKPNHPHGLYLDKDGQPYEGSLVGQMIPQPRFQRENDTVLLDDLIGCGFALIAQDGPGRAALDALEADHLLGLPLAKIHLPQAGSVRCDRLALIDEAVARPLRTHRDQILLIRPDRYCAAAASPDALDTMLNRYARALGD